MSRSGAGEPEGAPKAGDESAPAPTGRTGRWTQSLSLRLAVLISVAMLPLGLIAISQTGQLDRELDRVRSLNLAVTTADVARREGEAIDTALGAANALAATYLSTPRSAAVCNAALERFAARYEGRVTFVAFIPLDGMTECATLGQGVDFSLARTFDLRMAQRRSFVVANADGFLSGEPVVTAFSPVFAPTGVFRGMSAISVIKRGPLDHSEPVPETTGFDYMVMDAAGRNLSASPDGSVPYESFVPEGFDLAEVLADDDRSFVAEGRDGVRREYVLANAFEESGYVLGSRLHPTRSAEAWILSPQAFPLLMWVATLILVFAGLEHSLVGPVRSLAARMRRFGQDRSLETPAPDRPLPTELRSMDATFAQTAQELLRDEAALKAALRDKDVLLKEVHHRVKNNLQMILSMINLQLREVDDAGTEAALEKVSGRIASLAAVHRQVYAAQRPSEIRANEVLREVVLPLSDTVLGNFPAAHRPRLELDLALVTLTPDQAVPAAMMVAEAFTTALSWTLASAGGDRWVRIRLKEDAPAEPPDLGPLLRVTVECNADQAAVEGPGTAALGSRLVKGFARQLRGKLETYRDGEINVFSLRFRALPFSQDALSGRDRQ
ncbi:sensor histidine kinase [Roseisalinus antarcticus]|uniref:histidine kinase n=1 Tax=Roseisalinus antarcticus TaxID=254357 RepID=A0A1Y5TZ12_9RHOB|nr:sensor histidine kinase [Roseisalinus antarcticus]SLN76892.1 putative sensor histidine kinase pdtaS [Roseisalinus antarcticus]